MRRQISQFVVLILLAGFAAPLVSAGPLKAISSKLSARTPLPASAQIHEKWAVIVGIKEFQDASLPPLKRAEHSALSVAGALADPAAGRFAADHIVVLRGMQADRATVEDSIARTWLLRKALPRDLVLLYFCSRTIASADGKELYLCAYDTDTRDAEHSGIALKNLLKDLRHQIQSKFIFCLLDTAPVNTTNGGSMAIERLSRESGVTVFGMPIRSLPPAVQGDSFAHYLCQALRTGLGMMPLQDLCQFVIGHMQDAATIGDATCPVPTLAAAADGQDLLTIAAGLSVKSSRPVKKVLIGYPVDKMFTRAELPALPGAAADAADEEDEQDEQRQHSHLDFGGYLSKMKQDIQQKWQPPAGLENRRVVTSFRIARDGQIINPAIVESSGVDAVDQAALKALKDASPLSALPHGAPRSVQIRYKFDWQVKPH